MQHDPDHDGHIDVFSHSTNKYGEQKEHIDLKQFPSHSHYSAAEHIDDNSFSACSSDITQPTPDLSKSSYHKSLHRSLKMNNRIFPKIRRRPFQCRYCSFTCPSATNLSIHMRIHTGEKPYKCGTCSYASARKQNLFRHITTVHKSDPVEASATLQNAYPIGLQPTIDDGLPIVENVYGNVQDVVFVDGESVKVIGRDQSQYPTSELPSSPHITQVFSCDSASSSSSQQPDVVDVTPVTNPTSATEFSTRHYADGSRFIFASGNVATTINTKISQTSVIDPQFNTNSEIIPQQTQSGAMNNGAQQLQQASSQIAISTKKTEAPIQPIVYKEPITGAMKRKQGKSSSHTTLKTILDSPLILQNKNTGNSTIASSSVSSFHPLKTINSGMKMIQSEEDLEDVLEGRQKNFRTQSSIVSNKQREFSSTGSVGDIGSFSYPRESPDVVYTQETSRKVRTPDMLPQQTHIGTSQTRIFRRNQFPIMNSSPMRISKEKSIKSPESTGSISIKQTVKRPVISNVPNRKNMGLQSSENRRQVNIQNYQKGPTVKERNVPVPAGKEFQDRKRSPVVHLENDQNFIQEGSRQMSPRRYGRGSLTVQVDLSKLLCCAARKLLQAHLEECDVCEINLPLEKEERQFGYRGQPGCSPRFEGKQENNDIFGRKENRSQEIQGRRYADGQQASVATNAQQVVTIDMDDEMDLVDLNNSRNSVHEPSTVSVSPGVDRQVSEQRYVVRETNTHGPFSSHRRPRSPSSTEPSAVANTSVVGSSSVPISSPYVQPSAPQFALDHSAAKQLKSKQSAEILAYMNAELQQGMKQRQLRKCDLCGKVYHSKAQLRNHRRVHIETRQLFRCTVCRYCTVHYKFLKRHIMQKHVSKKPNATPEKICKGSIKTGEMVHTDEGEGTNQEEVPTRDSSLSLDENDQPPEKHCKDQEMVTVDTDDCTLMVTDLVMSQETETEGSTAQISATGEEENATIVTMEVKQEEIPV